MRLPDASQTGLTSVSYTVWAVLFHFLFVDRWSFSYFWNVPSTGPSALFPCLFHFCSSGARSRCTPRALAPASHPLCPSSTLLRVRYLVARSSRFLLASLQGLSAYCSPHGFGERGDTCRGLVALPGLVQGPGSAFSPGNAMQLHGQELDGETLSAPSFFPVFLNISSILLSFYLFS